MADLYDQRGVSSSKGDVHNAIKHHDPGLFSGAFCKVIPDYLTGDPEYCLAMHADGAGTKAAAAYVAWKEGFPMDVWKGIAQDSLIMNIDDLGCIGAAGPFIVNQSIGRNKFLIPGSVVSEVINGCQAVCDQLSSLGFPTIMAGGETADLPDLVRTIVVDNSVICRLNRKDIIDASNIVPGDIIIGFSSIGQASWEDEPNSGLGSNGFTNARHDVFSPKYGILYPEIICPEMPRELVYRGKYMLNDVIEKDSIAEMILSPTRTYLPLIKILLEIPKGCLHGLIHCSGGGQTKILKFGQMKNVYLKDNLFPVPSVFQLIRKESGVGWREMYKTFNMGHRLEAVVPKEFEDSCFLAAERCGIEARKVGHVEAGTHLLRKLSLKSPDGDWIDYSEGE